MNGPESRPLLQVDDVTLRFGGVTALSGVGFEVAAGEICGLVGPNGAGKTSLFNCVSGYYRPSAGRIRVSGRDVLAAPPHRMVDLGIARTFQQPALQADRSVLDNVLLGGHSKLTGNALAYLLALPMTRRQERALNGRARARSSTSGSPASKGHRPVTCPTDPRNASRSPVPCSRNPGC